MTRIVIAIVIVFIFYSGNTYSQDSQPKEGKFTKISKYRIPESDSSLAIMELPPKPSEGDVVGFTDYSGILGIKNLIIDPGSYPINGKKGNIAYSFPFASINYIFIDKTIGWETYSSNLEDDQRASQVAYPEDFGAVGNGVTDDYNALVAFFNYITGSGIKGYFKPNKTYFTSTEVTHFIDGDFNFDGQGSTIARSFKDLNGQGSEDVIEFRQTISLNKKLSLPFSTGDTLLKIDDTVGVRPGMGMIVYNGYWDDINGVLEKDMINKVTNLKAGNWIGMASKAPTDFNTTYEDYIGQNPPYTVETDVLFFDHYQIEIRNLKVAVIGNPNDLKDNPAKYHLLRTNLLWDPIIENCEGQNGGRTCFIFSRTYGAQISGLTNNYFSKNVYGVLLNTVVNSKISNSVIKAYSPAFIVTASCTHDVLFDNIDAQSENAYGFDSHGNIDGKVINSTIEGVGLSAGDWIFDNCEFYGKPDYSVYFSGESGSGTNKTIRLNVLVDNSDFYGMNSTRIFVTSETGNYESLNTWTFKNSVFRTDEFLFLARRNNIYINNVFSIPGEATYEMADSSPDTYDYTSNSYYTNFTEPALTNYDIGGLSAMTGIAKIKLYNGTVDRTIYESEQSQNFFVRVNNSGKIYVHWRESSDKSYQYFSTYGQPYTDGHEWRTVAFVLKNISGTTGEGRVYIDGKLAHVEHNILFSSIYSLSDINLCVGAIGDNGSPDNAMESALFFDRALAANEINYYSSNLSRGNSSNAPLVLLENKTYDVWMDDSGNGHDAVFANAVTLNKTPVDNGISFYYDFSSGRIETNYDLNGITGMSALIKAKLVGESDHCLLGEKSGNIFHFQIRNNNTIELKYKNSAGNNPLLVFDNGISIDTLWHTYGFTLGSNTAQLYIDGTLIESKSTAFTSMQAYERLVNIGQKGTSGEINACINSVLIFDKKLSSQQMGNYSNNPSLGVSSSGIALLENKTKEVWSDDSGNGFDGTVGPGIILNMAENQNGFSYYSNFTNGNISTDFDMNGIPAMSALVKAKFDNVSKQTLLGESSGNIFFFRVRENNTIELKFKNSAGNNPVLVFNNTIGNDTLWHTYGFTLGNNVAILYIDGVAVESISTVFTKMQLYTRTVNIGQRGSSDGVNGSISSVLIFDEKLSSSEMGLYTDNPSDGAATAAMALINNKEASSWYDDSTNGYIGDVGPGIVLNFSSPDPNPDPNPTPGFYTDFTSGKITTDLDLNGFSGLSALVTAKFNDETRKCLLGESSGNIFYFRIRENNTIELKFKNSAGNNPVLVFNNPIGPDNNWHTYGFTLGNNQATLFIDGVAVQTISTVFAKMQLYTRLVNIGQRGSTDGVNGSIATVLVFDQKLSQSQMASYTTNPDAAATTAAMALINNKTTSVWSDDSGNNKNGTVGTGIILEY